MNHNTKTNLTEAESIDKIRTIIKKEFTRELQYKENEVKRIDENLRIARLLLKQVRYAALSSYYSKTNLKVNDSEIKNFELLEKQRNPKTSLLNGRLEETKNILLQQPVHPSLKKLIGKRPVDYDEILCMRKPRQAAQSAINLISEKLNSKKKSNKQQNSKNSNELTQSSTSSSNDISKKIPRYITPSKSDKNIGQLNSARGKNQIKNTIVCGNISKYIGNGNEDSDSLLSHKWMVFIKTREGFPVEEIVEKARFHLHSSYRPNDIVDVNSPPFQLTRRGWGEFPMRIELFFRDFVQQKPIQIIHKLTLDKTLSGKQTLSAETLVELYLNADISSHINMTPKLENDDLKITSTCVHPPIKLEPNLGNIFDVKNTTEKMKCETTEISNEAPKELLNGHVKTEKLQGISKPETEDEELQKDLLEALRHDHEYCTPLISNEKNKANNQAKIILPYFSAKRNEPHKKLEVEFFKCQFKNVQKAVEFLFNKLPLIDQRVRYVEYKKAFPFMSESINEWNKMHFVKQRYKLWSRSKFISNLMKRSKKFEDSQLWTTKEILIFSKEFGYCNVSCETDLSSVERQGDTLKTSTTISTISINSNVKSWLTKYESSIHMKDCNSEEIIDIIDEEEVSPSNVNVKTKLLQNCDYQKNLEQEFVNLACKNTGVQLKPEEIFPGIFYSGASTALVAALKCFLEDLLKRAIEIHKSQMNGDAVDLSVDNIKKALLSRPEFDMLTNAGLGSGDAI